MHSIDQTLDHLANLYLTGPLEDSHPGLRLNGSSVRSLPLHQARPVRIPPQRSLAAHHRWGADSDRLNFAHIETEMSPLEQAVIGSLESPVQLAVRSPRDRRIRLFVDRHGRIHLWRRQTNQDLHACVVSLITARFWVKENIELIALTQPSCPFDLNAEPMLHVLTSDAAKARTFDGLLGPYMKVHVQATSLPTLIKPER